LDDTTLKLFEMCAKFKGVPSEDGLVNIRASLEICVQEIRRLRAENERLTSKGERWNIQEAIRQARGTGTRAGAQLESEIEEAKRLIALGKAVEEMDIDSALTVYSTNGVNRLWWLQYDHWDSPGHPTPLEALQAAKETS
jgi:hypothetical protein